MLLSEYLPTNCSTAGLFGLSKQISDILVENLPAGTLTNISDNVVIAGSTTLPYLQSAAASALIAAIEDKGTKPRLVHALRVLPQQYAVFYWFTHGKKCGVVLAATPSASPHERAIAIDIQNHSEWIPVLKKHNWKWRGAADPPTSISSAEEIQIWVVKEFARSKNSGTDTTLRIHFRRMGITGLRPRNGWKRHQLKGFEGHRFA